MKPAETGLIWSLIRQPAADLEGLRTRAILQTARALADGPPEHLPPTLLERLNEEEAALVTGIGQAPVCPAPAEACAQALKRLRYERERAGVQREIDQLQQLGAVGDDARIDALWRQKKDLSQRIEALELGI